MVNGVRDIRFEAACRRRRRGGGTAFCVLLALLCLIAPASVGARAPYAPPRITITDGTLDPLPIAVARFEDSLGGSGQFGTRIPEVIRGNLDRSGLFASISESAFIDAAPRYNQVPRFGDWRLLDAQLLVTGQVRPAEDGHLKVVFALWDVVAEEDIAAYEFAVSRDSWRRVGHMISDRIYETMTGEKGYFDTRVVFVAESGPKINRMRQLAIMDQDGANPMFLTKGHYIVQTPRFSPMDQQIVYTAFGGPKREAPRIYLLDIESGKHEIVGDFTESGADGMAFAPQFTPDGQGIVMSLSKNGNTDIYLKDLRTRRLRRLTTNPSIEVSPSFSPDGRQLTFTSDRSGSEQIYVMNVDGSGVKRISFSPSNAYYSTPVWSPRGDLIAFTKRSGGRWHIGVMSPNGQNERLLTESFQDEAPTWSPNGRVLMFFRTRPSRDDGSGGEVSLWSVDLTGHNERRVDTFGYGASDPAWSPLRSRVEY